MIVYGSAKEKRLAYLDQRTSYETTRTVYNKDKDLYYNYDNNNRLISIQRLVNSGTKEVITKKYYVFEQIENIGEFLFHKVAFLFGIYGIYYMKDWAGFIAGGIVYYFFSLILIVAPYSFIEKIFNQKKHFEEFKEYEFVNMGGGFNMKSTAILYYICINESIYKIGITNNSVQERFSSKELKRIRIVKTWDYEVGKDAFKKEQSIIKTYKKFRYKTDNLLESGNTELFNKDVLQLDTGTVS